MSENVPLDMCAQRRFRSVCAFAQTEYMQTDQNLHWAHYGQPRMQRLFMRTTKINQTARMHRLICVRWPDAHVRKYNFSRCGSNIFVFKVA